MSELFKPCKLDTVCIVEQCPSKCVNLCVCVCVYMYTCVFVVKGASVSMLIMINASTAMCWGRLSVKVIGKHIVSM